MQNAAIRASKDDSANSFSSSSDGIQVAALAASKRNLIRIPGDGSASTRSAVHSVPPRRLIA